MISGIYLGVIFAKERSSQSFWDCLFFPLQHYKGIPQVQTRKLCGTGRGKIQERGTIYLDKRKERKWGRKNEFVLWEWAG